MDNDRRSQLVMDAIASAVDRRFDHAMNLMEEIAADTDRSEMYGVCRAIAEAGRQALIRLYGNPGPEALWALNAPDPADGPQHPAHTFAHRFLTAHANHDAPTCQALYLAAAKASDDDFGHSVVALLGDTARLSRFALEQLAEQGKPATILFGEAS